jgi:hypothetical protein
MTSWLGRTATTIPKISGLYFETTNAGFCSIFNEFLYAYLYATVENRTLYVNDVINVVGNNFPLIKNTFVDLGVEYVDSMVANCSTTRRHEERIIASVSAIPMEKLRARAQAIFQWNPALVEKAREIILKANIPASFDAGVHIRTKKTGTVAIEKYIQAIRKKHPKKESMNIFLMSDSPINLAEFRKKADSSWKIFTLPTIFQDSLNRTASQRMAAYYSFMAELIVMQSISDIVCTMSSNVGRFLYLTVEHPEKIVSLDVPY